MDRGQKIPCKLFKKGRMGQNLSDRPWKTYGKRKIFHPIYSINKKQMFDLKNSRPEITVLLTKVLLFENLKHLSSTSKEESL